MSAITFLSTEIDTKVIKCNLKEKMKDVCNRYAKEVNINIKRLLFFSDGQRLKKKCLLMNLINQILNKNYLWY
jgi:hypothetical protein